MDSNRVKNKIDKRKPPRPWALLGALQESIHKNTGKVGRITIPRRKNG